MGSADWRNLWTLMADLEERVTRPEVVPHEESDLHRVFCDERFCLERGPMNCDNDESVSVAYPRTNGR